MARAAIRARARSAKVSSGARTRRDTSGNRHATRWETGEFVAVDGEGFSEGETLGQRVGVKKTPYIWKRHYYAYLSASDGSNIYSPRGRLSTEQCLDFLCAIVERNPNAILVAFGASYDCTHILAHDLPKADLETLVSSKAKSRKVHFGTDKWDYLIEYRPRKCLTVQRWPSGARRYEIDQNGKRKATPHLTVRLWDVWGFFQDSFIGVLKKWVPGDPDYEFVRRMKGDRNIFERSEIAEIARYNAAELRLLVKVMNRVRDAIADLGLKITRWDGAGAIAAAMLTHQGVKKHKGELPPEVFEAARRAYSGGHIEACKVGYHRGKVHHYDVNSAYPDQFRLLPSLADGEWIEGTQDPPDGYTLIKVDYVFPQGLPFYPIFFRTEDGSIIYPYRGTGWIWRSEFDVGRRYYDQSIENHPLRSQCKFQVLRWFHFRSHTGERPFAWVEDYYRKRQDYIEAARRGGYVSGPEKIIKLGLNSLYGKTAQQVGARIDHDGELHLPPFFQLDWAGFVTAGCRAKLMEAAIQKPHAIISFATDGLFSTEPLDLDCPKDKVLGAWEYVTHDGMTNVMPGVYWLHDGEDVKHYSRGFDKKEMSDAEFVHAHWRRKQETARVKINRMVGIGSAVSSKDFWRMRGCFAETTRSLRLDGDNSKRYPIELARAKPHQGLIDTVPRDHFLPNIVDIGESRPYPVAWIDGEIERDTLEGEMADEMEVLDAELA